MSVVSEIESMSKLYTIKVQEGRGVGYSKPCIVNGIQFPSIIKACAYLGISEGNVQTNRYNLQLSTEDAMLYTLAKKKIQEERRHKKNIEWQIEKERREKKRLDNLFTFEGKTYEHYIVAIISLAWENDIYLNPDSIKASAKRNGCTLQEQIRKTIDKHIAQGEKEYFSHYTYKEKKETYESLYHKYRKQFHFWRYLI